MIRKIGIHPEDYRKIQEMLDRDAKQAKHLPLLDKINSNRNCTFPLLVTRKHR